MDPCALSSSASRLWSFGPWGDAPIRNTRRSVESIVMSGSVGKVGQWLLAGMLLALVAALVGCGQGAAEGPTTYPVKGTVVAPGGKPWRGGRVGFQSVKDPGTRATGEIQSDGSFALE